MVGGGSWDGCPASDVLLSCFLGFFIIYAHRLAYMSKQLDYSSVSQTYDRNFLSTLKLYVFHSLYCLN